MVQLDRLLPDPHPSLVFEIGERVLLGAKRDASWNSVRTISERALPEASQDGPDLPLPDGLATGIESLIQEIRPDRSRLTSVLLPDAAVRLAVFRFESLPWRARDLRAAVEDRFRASLPFDVQTVRISFHRQPDKSNPSVLAAAVPSQYLEHCEEAVRSCGLVPAFVGPSAVGALNLVEGEGVSVVLRKSEQSLTIAAVAGRVVELVRRIALPEELGPDSQAATRDVLSDLLPTIALIEGQVGTAASRLFLTGFGVLQRSLVETLPEAVGIRTGPLPNAGDASATCGPGLLGYVHG